MEQETEVQPSVDQALLEELVKAGVLFGRSKSKTNPRMKKYIEATRAGVEIFSPQATLESLDRAAAFLQEAAKSGKMILVAGVQPAAREAAQTMALKFGLPYVTERWLGGTLTNFKTISQRLHYYMNLKADQASGKLEKYTKKERLDFDKEIQRLTILFGGLEKLAKPADILLTIDVTEHHTAVREARRLGAAIVALINSNNDPENIDYPIPCNTAAKSSIEWVMKKLEDAIQTGLNERQALMAQAAAQPESK